MLLAGMKIANKKVLSKEQLMEWAKQTNEKLIVMAGAGDIDVCITDIQNLFSK
jgi:copper homeostasis protein CutC